MTKGDFGAAVEHYTTAIANDPSNHVLYSNRSGAYASLKNFDKALEDANKTIELKPDWFKGYSRKGTALCYMSRYDEAKAAYEAGLKIDPNNDQLKQALQEVEAQEQREPDIGDLFGNIFRGDIWSKLKASESTRAYMEDPAFVNLMGRLQSNPSEIGMHLRDPRVAAALGVLMGLPPKATMAPKTEKSEPKAPEKPKEEKKPEPPKEPEPELPPEKKQALEEKELGNAAYKKKDFDNAVAHYKKAIELDPENIAFQTNLAAAYFEMRNYDECINTCQTAIETGRRIFADYKIIARAFQRMGNAYVKQEKYNEAISAFNAALTEHRTPETLDALRKAEKLKKEKDEKDYINPELSLEAKNKGNECFKLGQVPEAIQHYTEAIRRSPNDHVLYSNRAAAYTKLGEYPLGIRDCDKAIELCPTFVKAYTRKGHLQFFLKQYHKCLETYDQGLKLEPENAELIEGVKRTIEAINRRQDLEGEEAEKEASAAASDPEIQRILSDPAMRQVLQTLGSNPQSLSTYMKDPVIMAKIQKLIAAGIIRTK